MAIVMKTWMLMSGINWRALEILISNAVDYGTIPSSRASTILQRSVPGGSRWIEELMLYAPKHGFCYRM